MVEHHEVLVVAHVDIVVLGQVDSDIQRHARKTSLKGLLQVVLLVLLITISCISLR